LALLEIFKIMNEEQFHYYYANFYGYGNWNGDTWFIGKEEGGGNAGEDDGYADCNEKIVVFNNQYEGDGALLDLRNFHLDLDHGLHPWFYENSNLQGTWKLPLTILNPDVDNLIEQQRNHFGRLESNHALIELMPLPNPKDAQDQWRNRWPDWTGTFINPLPLDKEAYRVLIRAQRVQFISDKLGIHRPTKIICYIGGANSRYRDWIRDVIRNFDPTFHNNDWIEVTNVETPRKFTSCYYDLQWENTHTRIIVTYQSTVRVGKNNNWDDFFDLIMNLIQQ
jgi:hypothetical protein